MLGSDDNPTHPARPIHTGWAYDVRGWAPLAEGRDFVVGLYVPPSTEMRPRVELRQYEDVALPALPGDEWSEQDGRVLRHQATGALWIYPEDLPAMIEALNQTLQTLRKVATETDAFPLPAYWGDLDRSE